MAPLIAWLLILKAKLYVGAGQSVHDNNAETAQGGQTKPESQDLVVRQVCVKQCGLVGGCITG